MWTLLRRCAEVREPIELSFGAVSGVGPGIHVGLLDGSSRAQKERGCFRDLHWRPIGLNGHNDVFFAQKCIRLVREKLIIFLYGQYIFKICDSLAFRICT